MRRRVLGVGSDSDSLRVPGSGLIEGGLASLDALEPRRTIRAVLERLELDLEKRHPRTNVRATAKCTFAMLHTTPNKSRNGHALTRPAPLWSPNIAAPRQRRTTGQLLTAPNTQPANR